MTGPEDRAVTVEAAGLLAKLAELIFESDVFELGRASSWPGRLATCRTSAPCWTCPPRSHPLTKRASAGN